MRKIPGPRLLLFLLMWLVLPSAFLPAMASDYTLPKHNLQCDESFPCPEEIRRRVDFWIQVFKEWGKSKAILHDPNVPERVYMVVDTGHGCNRPAAQTIKARRSVVSHSLEAMATNIAKGRPITDARQKHYLTLFADPRPSVIRNAARSIRCQSGVRDSFAEGLKRFNRYSPMVDRVLADNRLPADIRYLPFVESSYNPRAYSRAGAAGLWQIMPATARDLGLELNASMDERMHPEAATRAAARYFTHAINRLSRAAREKNPAVTERDINPFVITSYNYGVNGMHRAINRVSPDYMEVLNNYKSPGFQIAVKNFYASFLAARHVAQNARRYFGTVVAGSADEYQVLMLENPTSINRIKKVFGLGEDELKPLNPSLTRFIWNGWRMIPAGYELHLPPKSGGWNQDFAELASLAPEKVVPGGGHYTVRRGDTACGIATALRVNCKTLIRANNLGRKAVIRVGQKLVIPRQVVADTQSGTGPTGVIRETRIETYTVRRGDTACGIAERFGVSCREFIRSNNLSRKARILVGQKLQVTRVDYVPGTPAGLNADNRYVVRKGDMVCLIAERFSVSCRQLVRLNNLGSRAIIHPGQKLRIPGFEGQKTSDTAMQLAEATGRDGSVGTETDNKFANLLDTLPDMSVQVDSNNDQPVYSATVEVDETLGHFADWLGLAGSYVLRRINNLQAGTPLQLGQRIVFPKLTAEEVNRFEQKRVEYHQVLSESLKENYRLVGIESYRVQSGDSLWQMSREQGFPLWLLYRMNPQLRVSGLLVGGTINLPELRRL